MSLTIIAHKLMMILFLAVQFPDGLIGATIKYKENTRRSFIKGLMGTVMSNTILPLPKKKSSCNSVPENFDARDAWPYCESVNETRVQNGCGSCWAIGVASVMTDRICILTGGVEKTYISEYDIMNCCPNCLLNPNDTCSGGMVSNAWSFVKRVGVVSGSNYGHTGGCKSYNIKPCEIMPNGYKNTVNGPCRTKIVKPQCIKKCSSNIYLDYEEDKIKFGYIERVTDPKCNIYTNGPIVATMNIYEDFLSYEAGEIYTCTGKSPSEIIGHHSVRIVGWGVDKKNNTDYWIGANSWGASWGDNGFFKIARGNNHCNIEQYMTAGLLK